MPPRGCYAVIVVVALLSVPPVTGQEANPLAPPITSPLAAPATTALDELSDIEFLRVFQELAITPAQAAALADDLRALQTALASSRAATERAVRESAAALPDLRQAVARGQTLAESQRQLAERLAQVRNAADRQENALRELAYQRLLNRLTAGQLALLGNPGAAATSASGVATDPNQAAARLQQSYLAYGNLFRQARNTPQPNRFRALAPAEIVRTNVATTALPAGNTALATLNRQVAARLQQIYYLKPLQYAQLGPSLAWELAVASEQARRTAAGLGTQRPLAPARVDPARLRRAVSYERGAALLQELAARSATR